MQNTAKSGAGKVPSYEEFLGYDEKGNPVVLRRTTAHPGLDAETAALEEQFAGRAQTVERPLRSSGSMRFFCDAREFVGPLHKKTA